MTPRMQHRIDVAAERLHLVCASTWPPDATGDQMRLWCTRPRWHLRTHRATGSDHQVIREWQ